MLTLRTPSFHVGAGRAFTENDPASDTLCRSAAPASRLLFRPPAAAPHASQACRVGFHCESQSRPTVPSFARSHLPVTRRWRNDPGCLPSYQLPCELAHDRTGVSARPTQRLATLDRATHHASSVTIRRDACAPFRLRNWFHPAPFAEHADACAPHHSARCNPSCLEMGHRRPRQRVRRFAPG
jgi:hypothetical protein